MSGVQVKRLLLPLQGQDSDAPQRLCLLDFLCTVVPLRDSVVRLVLDKMIQCCSPEGLPGLAASSAPPARPPKHAARAPDAGERSFPFALQLKPFVAAQQVRMNWAQCCTLCTPYVRMRR